MIKKTNLLYAGLLASGLLFTACDDIKKTFDETFNNNTTATNAPSENTEEDNPEKGGVLDLITPKEKAKPDFAADVNALQNVEDELRARPEFKGKTINVYRSIHFYDDYRVMLKIQNPDNPRYVDEYYYHDGKWHEPKPVVLSKNENVAEDILPLDKTPFVNAHNAYTALTTKMHEIGSKDNDVTVYVIVDSDGVRWYPTEVSNDRSRYSITYNSDGTLKSFEQE